MCAIARHSRRELSFPLLIARCAISSVLPLATAPACPCSGYGSGSAPVRGSCPRRWPRDCDFVALHQRPTTDSSTTAGGPPHSCPADRARRSATPAAAWAATPPAPSRRHSTVSCSGWRRRARRHSPRTAAPAACRPRRRSRRRRRAGRSRAIFGAASRRHPDPRQTGWRSGGPGPRSWPGHARRDASSGRAWCCGCDVWSWPPMRGRLLASWLGQSPGTRCRCHPPVRCSSCSSSRWGRSLTFPAVPRFRVCFDLKWGYIMDYVMALQRTKNPATGHSPRQRNVGSPAYWVGSAGARSAGSR